EHRKRRRKWLERLGSNEAIDTEEKELEAPGCSHLPTSDPELPFPGKRLIRALLMHTGGKNMTNNEIESRTSSIKPSFLDSFRHMEKDLEEEERDEEESDVESLDVPLRPNRRLEAGRKLPASISEEFCPRRLAGKPLKEIDPFYFDKR
ncbi:hypothetical protein Ciccas_014124, partial [Cichlidogyrus casuarinus]